jgi:hypothetical protein
MKKILNLIAIILIISCNQVGNKSNFINNEIDKKETKTDSTDNNKKSKIPEGLKKLLKAYPEFLDSADENNLYWKDGTIMQWDDGNSNKTHEEKLNSPDLEDMMSQKYVKGGKWDKPPAKNYEPGRIRYEPFFKKMYGDNSSAVQKNLVTVNWLPSICGCTVQFNKVNQAAEKLKNVSDEIEEKLGKEYYKYLSKTAGTFNWRNIAGTNRLSTHAFGTSIDINTKYSNYWQWDGNMIWKNQIPMEIVEIFEKHGFIWGGKWYHYDTMHFEYRPELLID